MRVSIDTNKFEKEIENIVKYSVGFLDGVQRGKTLFLKNLGLSTVEALKAYVDVEARSNPQALHHVYEWYETGSPSARLFDIDYTISNLGLSISGTFMQSRTLQTDSNVPFYNKARIMESGIPVTITPSKSAVLAFDVAGETVFTPNPVTIRNPGGNYVQGSFENIIDEFIRVYFKQSFLRASGLYDYINNPTVYKTNINAGSKLGKSKGVQVGFKWITNAKIGVK